ncbi:MAG: hypothetical protein ILO36_07165 [Abditibacteriota bacterium]|nr:hypothetical protein [Abditibacteriota bacterium]
MKKTLATALLLLLSAAAMALGPGDTVLFGRYPQTEKEEVKPVEWTVLSKYDDGTAMLISSSILDGVPYSDNGKTEAYSRSRVRQWLNSTFLDACFTKEEKARLEKGSFFDFRVPDSDEELTDLVFLPEDGDVWYDMESAKKRRAYPTPFAAKKKGLPVDKDGLCAWMLAGRTPDCYTMVSSRGKPTHTDINKYPVGGVRPCITVKDADALAVKEKAKPEPQKSVMPTPWKQGMKVKKGDVISFGNAEQDGIAANGKEAIDWIVLSADEKEILVVSRYILYTRDFGARNWDDSPLRTFLNDTFYKGAFTDRERKCILTTENTTVDHDYEYNPEGDYTVKKHTGTTLDKIFILSMDEADTLFSSAVQRNTPYTKSGRPKDFVPNETPNCFWTRDRGHFAACVMNGHIYADGSGDGIDEYPCGVRPAMRLAPTGKEVTPIL